MVLLARFHFTNLLTIKLGELPFLAGVHVLLLRSHYLLGYIDSLLLFHPQVIMAPSIHGLHDRL
jgi:hypothetical protein